ncbi:MAG: DUF2071 domain-containing protein [Pirellulaceae bacterium]|jgi:uncharacterized protein YqjF (DUF2071 family)|nr:DUF2071 domain-containing protein [Pirellulaceae bacterium]|tara:strand:- start:3446 stop:4135 length:690 start_codon:yes stop_codon:yes gene_type:complete
MKWQVKMGWHNTLFLHWRVPTATLQNFVPDSLTIDTFDSDAWIGIVAFEMHDVRKKWMPYMPSMRSYPELNVRTYVKHGDHSGVFFLSLDTPEWFTRTIGKHSFHLPYRKRAIQYVVGSDSSTHYQSNHCDGTLEFDITYRPAPLDDNCNSTPSDFISWSSERYGLYNTNKKLELMWGEVKHSPWPIQSVTTDLRCHDILKPYGLHDQPPDMIHYSPGVDTFAAGLTHA